MPAMRQFKLGLPDAGKHQLWWFGAALAVFIGQQVAQETLGLDGWEAFVRRAVLFVTTPLLVLMALAFRRYTGAWLIAIGITLNFIPMAAHGGLMPIALEAIEASGYYPHITEANIGHQLANSKDIVLYASDVRFAWFSDRYPVSVPGYGPNIYSLGDFILFAGAAIAMVEAVVAAIRPDWRPLALARRSLM